MSRDKELRDLAIIQALSGSEDLIIPGMHIEDDYLRREKMENRREQGFWVSKKWLPESRTELEKLIWKGDRMQEALYLERWVNDQDESESHLAKEYDEDRLPIQVSKRIVKI